MCQHYAIFIAAAIKSRLKCHKLTKVDVAARQQRFQESEVVLEHNLYILGHALS